jgi:hypothetical protein
VVVVVVFKEVLDVNVVVNGHSSSGSCAFTSGNLAIEITVEDMIKKTKKTTRKRFCLLVNRISIYALNILMGK